jgi:hypothetical protein
MKTHFPVTFANSTDDLWTLAGKRLGRTEYYELRYAFQLLTLWRDEFRGRWGELKEISHLSNPDDPPDVIAHFANASVNIEVTSIDPEHICQYSKLGGTELRDVVSAELPLSHKPANKSEALEIMSCPGHSMAWARTEDECRVRREVIHERVQKKLQKATIQAIEPGILLLTGDVFGDRFEHNAIKEIFAKIAAMPDLQAWLIAIVHCWNSVDFYTAIQCPKRGFKFKRRSYNCPIESAV